MKGTDVTTIKVEIFDPPMCCPGGLCGPAIDPDKSTEEYRERILAPMRMVMPKDVIKVLEEQFNSPCTTEIASFVRFVGLMTAPDAANIQT